MTGRQTRTRQTFKDSCKNCASAKVKCSKEKPVCARCIERGLPCSYGLSHRYGRLPAAMKLKGMTGDEHQSSTTPPSPRALLPSQSATSSPSTDPGDLQYSWLDSPGSGLSLGTGSPTMFNGCMDFGYDPSLPQNLMHANFHGIPSSMTAWSGQELHQATTPPSSHLSLAVGSPIGGTLGYGQCLDPGPQPNSGRNHSRSASSAASFQSGFEYQPAGFSHTPPAAFCTPPETPCQAFAPGAHAAFGARHDCLSLASGILLAVRSGGLACGGEAAGREVADQMLQMIECDCFRSDEHARLSMVLVGLEIMARYSRSVRDFGAAGGTEAILEDLQVVARLIERLLRRLREFTSSSKGTRAEAGGGVSGQTSNVISTAVFRQLEADLRTNLRGISNKAMEALRRV